MRKNGEVLRWFSETVNQDRRAMGLRERWACGFVGLIEGKRDLVGVGSHGRR